MPDTSKLEKLNRELEKSEKKLRKAINDEKALQHQLKQLTMTASCWAAVPKRTATPIFVGLCTQILSICIFLVIYGRMIEVYLVTSIGPIPFATMVNREWGNTGQNYLRSLLALGFQAFLIMICVGIYAVLVEGISLSGDNISGAIWGCMGYTVLLCFTLFKTGSLAKSLFGAH